MNSFRCCSCGASFHQANSLTTLQCGHARCLTHEGPCTICHKSSNNPVPKDNWSLQRDIEAKLDLVRYGNELEVGGALIALRCWTKPGKSRQMSVLEGIGAQYLALLLKNPLLCPANKGHVVRLIEAIVADNPGTTVRCVSTDIVPALVELLQGESKLLREVVAVALQKMCAQDLLFRLALMDSAICGCW